MKHSLLLSMLLAPSAIHAMETILKNKEIVTYNLAPRLDRQDRMSLKLTQQALYSIIVPQHIINEQYTLACLKNDTSAMNECRRKGALNPDEEVYTLFLNNKPKIITKIIPHNHHDILAVFLYGVKKNNINFMQLLLDTKNPHFNSYLVENSLAHSKHFNHREITELLESYIQKQRTICWDETMKNVISTPELMEYTPEFIEYMHEDNTGEQNCIIS